MQIDRINHPTKSPEERKDGNDASSPEKAVKEAH